MYHVHRVLVNGDATHHNPDHYRFDTYLRRSMDHGRGEPFNGIRHDHDMHS